MQNAEDKEPTAEEKDFVYALMSYKRNLRMPWMTTLIPLMPWLLFLIW